MSRQDVSGMRSLRQICLTFSATVTFLSTRLAVGVSRLRHCMTDEYTSPLRFALLAD
jgi:hypothetical protein